jgi:hypothetical protein
MTRLSLILLFLATSFLSFSLLVPPVFAIQPEDIIVHINPDPPAGDDPAAELTVGGCNTGDNVSFTFNYLIPGDPLSGGMSIGTAKAGADGTAHYNNPSLIKAKYQYTVSVSCSGVRRDAALVFTVGSGTSSGTAGTPIPTQVPPPPPVCANDLNTYGQCTRVNTAIGPVNADQGIIYSIFIVILSMSGGVLVLTIIYAGYLMLSSRGNPEQVQKARETLTSAIVGFIFIIFSYLIFGVITADILHLPGFSTFTLNHP